MEKSSSIKEAFLFDNVKCCYTTVHGGFSKGNYASFNLGLHVNDDPLDVLKNRLELSNILQKKIVWMNQTHSDTVLYVDSSNAQSVDELTGKTSPTLGVNADGIVTEDKDIALAVLTADCLPLILVSEDKSICAAVHCGWRGIYKKIIDKTVSLMNEKTNSPLHAFIGPHIGKLSYEVGSDLLDNFVSVLGERAKDCFTQKDNGKYWSSLEDLVRLNLSKLNVLSINSCSIDTYTNTNYFSYRRNNVTGRLATLISLS